MTVGQPRTPASEPAVAETAALDRRLSHLEAERQSLAARREVWKVVDGRPANLEHRCRSVAARPSELSCENERLALAALGVKLYARDHAPRYDLTASIPLEDETGADHPRGSLYETPRVIGAGWPGFAPGREAPCGANRR